MDTPQTILHALRRRAAASPGSPALWRRRGGAPWGPVSWSDYDALARRFAMGLLAFGLEPGQRVALLGAARPEWFAAALGAMGAGGVACGLFEAWPDAVLERACRAIEPRFLVVEGREQLARLRAVRADLPQLEAVLSIEPVDEPAGGVRSFEEVLARGADAGEREWEARLEAVDPDADAAVIFTGGTTGEPRPAVHSHRALAWTASRLARACGAAGEILVSHLPPAHVAAQAIDLHLAVVTGSQVWFARSPARLVEALAEVRPTMVFAPPEAWERLARTVEKHREAEPAGRQRVYRWARRMALEKRRLDLAGMPVPANVAAQVRLAHTLVFGPLRQRLGLDRARVLFSGTAPLREEVGELLASYDLPVHEVYGQVEAGGPVALNVPGAARPGSCGRPLPGIEVRIAEDDELLLRTPAASRGFFGTPEAGARLVDEQGWLHTGDLAALDEDGFLSVVGRGREVFFTAAGRRISPDRIELRLRGIPLVAHAAVLGEGRAHLVAALTLAPAAATRFATERGLPDDPALLASHPTVVAWLEKRIEAVNRRLEPWEAIKRFAVLPGQLSVERGELTPIGKVRRRAVAEHYEALVEPLFG